MSLPSSSFAEYGASLLQAASTAERDQAAHLIHNLFDDSDERNTFANQFFGASLDQHHDSPVGLSDAKVKTTINMVPSSIHSNSVTQLRDGVTQLLPLINANSVPPDSPLLALNEQVGALFKCGPDIAVFVFLKLQLKIEFKTYTSNGAKIEIGIFSQDETDLSLSQDRSYSSNLWKSSFRQAKEAAEKNKQTAILTVNLADVHIYELGQQGASEQDSSFAHTFTIGVGPEGVIIWQAWGEHGCRLDEYLNDGHGRVRDWIEAELFVRDFDKLAAQKGSWDAKCNKLYKKLFLVDINKICGPNGPERPVTPRFKAWVRIDTISDVKYEDVTKFSWSIE